MSVIELKDVHKTYPLGNKSVEALRGVSCTFSTGATLLRGPSGSGKSTLLHLLGCLDKPTRGELRFMGEDVAGLSEKRLTRMRRNTIGFVFQSFHLLPQLNLADNIGYPLNHGRLNSTEKRTRVSRLLEQVGLAGYERRFPRELSGGERQRVAIARSLAAEPEVVIADEPTANLDSKTGGEILDLLLGLLEQRDSMALIIASHDEQLIRRLERQIVLKDGRLVS